MKLVNTLVQTLAPSCPLLFQNEQCFDNGSDNVPSVKYISSIDSWKSFSNKLQYHLQRKNIIAFFILLYISTRVTVIFKKKKIHINPFLPSVTYMARLENIFISISNRIIKKFPLGVVTESICDKSLSYTISRKTTENNSCSKGLNEFNCFQ